MICEARAAETH